MRIVRTAAPLVLALASCSLPSEPVACEAPVWTVEVLDPDGAIGYFFEPAIVADDSAHVAFTSSWEGLFYARRDGRGWAYEHVASNEPNSPGSPSLVLTESSEPRIAYSLSFFPMGYGSGQLVGVEVARRQDGEWTRELVHDAPGSYGGALSRSDDVLELLVFEQQPSRLLLLHGADAWSQETVVDGLELLDADGGLDASGTLHVVYTDGMESGLLHRQRTGDGWNEPVVIDPEQLLSLQSVAVAPSGDVYVDYFDRDTDEHRLMALRDGEWSALELPTVEGDPAAPRALAVGAAGELHALFVAGRPDRLFHGALVEETWTTALVDEEGLALAIGPRSLAVGPDGQPHVAYTRGGTGSDTLVYAHPRCP